MTPVSVRPKPKRPPEPTAYMLLGVPPAWSSERIHERYLELAFALHPDRGGDEEKFKAVTLAWGILRRAEGRRIYDQKLKLEGHQCSACEGRGERWTFKTRREAACEACGGTGQRK